MSEVCARCGTSNRDGALFCLGCAEKLPAFDASRPDHLEAEAPPTTVLQGERRDLFLATPAAEKSPLGFALLALVAIAVLGVAGWYFGWLPGLAPPAGVPTPALSSASPVPSGADDLPAPAAATAASAPSAASAASAPSASSVTSASSASSASAAGLASPAVPAASASPPPSIPPTPASPILASVPQPVPRAAGAMQPPAADTAAMSAERPRPKPASRPLAEAPWDPLRACANLDFGSMTSCWNEQCAGHPGDARCERLRTDQQRRDATRRLLPPGVVEAPGG